MAMTEYLNKSVKIGDVVRADTLTSPKRRSYYLVARPDEPGPTYALISLDQRGESFPLSLQVGIAEVMEGERGGLRFQVLSRRAAKRVLKRFGFLASPAMVDEQPVIIDGMPKGSFYEGLLDQTSPYESVDKSSQPSYRNSLMSDIQPLRHQLRAINW